VIAPVRGHYPAEEGDLAMGVDTGSRSQLTWWLVGLAAGVAAGLVPLVLGFVGIVMTGLVLVWAALARPRGVVLSGVFTGVGATWLILSSRASLGCSGANTSTEGCVGPDISSWQYLPIAFLILAGILALVTGLRRAT
jgi:hypothetical protein